MGRPLHSVYPSSTLDRILRTGRPEYNVSMKSLKDVRVLADRLPLYENGALAGAVGIFRNRTEVARLADDLTSVRHMVDAMRRAGAGPAVHHGYHPYPAGGGEPHHEPD